MILILKHNFTEKLSVVKLKFGFSALLHLYNNLLVNLYSNVVFLPLLSRYNEGPRDWENVFAMTRFFFKHSSLLLGKRKSFVIAMTFLYRG